MTRTHTQRVSRVLARGLQTAAFSLTRSRT